MRIRFLGARRAIWPVAPSADAASAPVFCAQGGEKLRLIENQVGVCLILATDRLRDEGDRANAQYLRQGHHDEHERAGAAHAGNCGVAERRDEIDVDEQV